MYASIVRICALFLGLVAAPAADVVLPRDTIVAYGAGANRVGTEVVVNIQI